MLQGKHTNIKLLVYIPFIFFSIFFSDKYIIIMGFLKNI